MRLLRYFLASFLTLFILGIGLFFKQDLANLIQGRRGSDSEADVSVKISRFLHKLMHAPEAVIGSEDSTSISEPNCLYYNCFDVYKCGDNNRRIQVHISEPRKILVPSGSGGQEVSVLSKDYVDILQAIIESDFYTEDASKACLFIPPFNLLNEADLDSIAASKALNKFDNWNGNGVNNLLMSFVTGNPDSLKLNYGKAMLAASGLSTFSYRNKFDVSLPFYTRLQEEEIDLNSRPKKYFAVNVQETELIDKLRPNLVDAWKEKSSDVQVFHRHHLNPNQLQDSKGKTYGVLEVLSQSKFCLIGREKYGRLSSPMLMAALHAGCVPVIVVDNLVLPFSEVLDWKRFSVRFYEHDDGQVLDFLRHQVSQRRYEEMVANGRFIYNSHFATLAKITTTTLEIINDRVFSQHAKTYRDWNLELDFQSPLFMKNIPPETDGFTAVILTYDRLESLFQVIKSVAETPSLSKILVVWNNQDKQPPLPHEFPEISKPLKVIQTQKNLLTNRFYPFDDITTEAVLSMDDDIVMLTADELEFAYQVWREFPDRLVGFPSRTHVWNNDTKQWKYESEWTNDVSMVLTGAAFYHKYWHFLFTATPSPESKEIKDWLDSKMNCEDIAMNFLIANATRKAPIKVTPRKKFKCSTPQCVNSDSLSNYQSHLVERSECVNFLVKKYGFMPLIRAEFRADPVLFKDKFPDKLKSFANIGSL